MMTPGLTEVGGAAHRSRLLVRGLVEAGWRVSVITRSGTTTRFTIHRSSRLLVLETPGFRRRALGALLFYLCAIPFGLIFGVRARAFLAIQLMSTSTAAAICGSILSRPFILFATTSGCLSEVAYLRQASLSRMRLALLSRAARVVAQSPAGAEELASVVADAAIELIPNPVASTTVPLLNGSPRALFSGRFSQEKDLLTLLEAWRSIAQERPEARLTLVGEGGNYRPVDAELRSAVSEDHILRSSVIFTGWVPDVGLYLAESDVYVFPSLSEGMSNALLEACAHGRVVVASDIPANKAVLGPDYPLLFAAGDPRALEDALRRAFDDETLRTDARRKIEEALVDFRLESVVSRIEKVIEDATHSPRHQHA